jgi:hypothetical protein
LKNTTRREVSPLYKFNYWNTTGNERNDVTEKKERYSKEVSLALRISAREELEALQNK